MNCSSRTLPILKWRDQADRETFLSPRDSWKVMGNCDCGSFVIYCLVLYFSRQAKLISSWGHAQEDFGDVQSKSASDPLLMKKASNLR